MGSFEHGFLSPEKERSHREQDQVNNRGNHLEWFFFVNKNCFTDNALQDDALS